MFAEVKLRASDRFVRAGAYVTPAKQARIRTAASLWLAEHETELQPRFDVIEITAMRIPRAANAGSIRSKMLLNNEGPDMNYYSTRDHQHVVSAAQAIACGLAPDAACSCRRRCRRCPRSSFRRCAA